MDDQRVDREGSRSVKPESQGYGAFLVVFAIPFSTFWWMFVLSWIWEGSVHLGRFGRGPITSRQNDPVEFWTAVAVCSVVPVVLLGVCIRNFMKHRNVAEK